MTAVRQFPPQALPPNQLFTPSQPFVTFNSQPTTPRTQLRGQWASEKSDAGQQRLPQRYAHPLQRNNSFPQASAREQRQESRQSEHMLRRKTPNGILAAAYDGTSVEQADKPHAMKHILLPGTAPERFSSRHNAAQSGIPQELPVRSSGPRFDGGFYQAQHSGSSGVGGWEIDRQFRLDDQNGQWSMGPPALPQIDSMLGQLPAQSFQVPYQHVYGGVVQPSLLSPLGPTASNEQIPYGPYWPNGTFIPYRPAAMRDPRFYSVATPHWVAQQTDGLQGPEMTPFNTFSPVNAQPHNMYFNRDGISNPNFAVYSNNSPQGDWSSPFLRNVDGAAPASVLRTNYMDGQSHLSQGYGAASLPVDPFSNNFTSRVQQYPHRMPLSMTLADFGPHSSNAQLRERVFTWAHTVYVDLLKYLHQTRRHNAQVRNSALPNNHPARPNIYPKPPRQPNASFHSPPPSSKKFERSAPGSPSLAQKIGLDGSDRALIPQETQWSAHSDGQQSVQWPSNVVKYPRSEHHFSSQWPYPQNPPVQRSHIHTTDKFRTLRRTSGATISGMVSRHDPTPAATATSAMETMTKLCTESSWQWIDGMLLVGCLAYALGDYNKALGWYLKILSIDANHVEAMSNLAATLLALNRRSEAEQFWMKAVKLRPSYFEAVEHLIGLLGGDYRTKEAVEIIEFVEGALRYGKKEDYHKGFDGRSETSDSAARSPSLSEMSDRPVFDYDADGEGNFKEKGPPGSDQPGFGSSGFSIPGSENGRILALIHAKGNMLYTLGDNGGAARAFELAVLIGAGWRANGITGLISHILNVVSQSLAEPQSPHEPILLPPDKALETSRLCFPGQGDLPGLMYVSGEGLARKAAVSTTSNSLLSLAKIFQDGMASNSSKNSAYQPNFGVRQILALYYLSLSLQPSPSTANNVGILLAGVQQSLPSKRLAQSYKSHQNHVIPGVVPGSGIALALQYYNYGLNLDNCHAHLFTNLGSLLKDIGQLSAAVKMYEQAVQCDGNFDIALANLANAVKDQGRISDAIKYYKRAVHASPDFAEAVCGLANALNSVCMWQGRGGIAADGGRRDRWHVTEDGMLLDATLEGARSGGWIKRVVDLVEKQLADGEDWGRGAVDESLVEEMTKQLRITEGSPEHLAEKEEGLKQTLKSWRGQKWEGARVVRLVERATRRLQWQQYRDRYVHGIHRPSAIYRRPRLPNALTVPAAPTVLPFHTFTCPMSAKQIRLISQRNGLRISCSTLKAPWLPDTVFPAPPPPNPFLKVGYVSSDFNNHPLAHLMQSVFGLHNPARVRAYCYATTASDNSAHREQIEREAPVFFDASSWPAEKLVEQIVRDGIHILINLNGYTRGARNEVFAARPAPIQMSFMGFAGTLGAEWCDYLLADEIAVPRSTLREWRRNVDLEDQLRDGNSGAKNEDWVYGENIIFCRDTFFCCDHRQSAPDAQGKQLTWEEEQVRRWRMRKEIFPNLADDVIILGNFNQLYKIEPTTFRTWLRILARVPNAVLWLLRFPDLGEINLLATAKQWAGDAVASRILFTDVAPKHAHIARARVCDLFLDTPECNAHTTAADVLWSGTPLLTLPRYPYKMCARMAASILRGALPRTPDGARAARELTARDEDDYQAAAVRLAGSLRYEGHRPRGRLAELRRLLYEARWASGLFDTRRWVADLEAAYEIAWGRWVRGEGGDIDLVEELGGWAAPGSTAGGGGGGNTAQGAWA